MGVHTNINNQLRSLMDSPNAPIVNAPIVTNNNTPVTNHNSPVFTSFTNDLKLIEIKNLYSKEINDNCLTDADLQYIIKTFNEESLAIWLMTEGKISNKNLYVNIKNFYATDIKFLIQFLEQKFKLNGIIFNNNCLEFNSNNIKKIYNITKRYIHPSMKFKFIF